MTKKLRVGATVPGSVPYSSIKMELEVNVNDGDDIYQVNNDAKELLAELISGEDPKIYGLALATLNCPGNVVKLLSKKRELETLKAELDALNVETDEIRESAKRALMWLDNQDFVDRLQKVVSRSWQNAESFKAIVEEIFPEVGDSETSDTSGESEVGDDIATDADYQEF